MSIIFKKLSLIIIMLILIVQLLHLPIVSASSSTKFSVIDVYWITSRGEGVVAPGDVVTLIIVLRYEGSSEVSGLVAELTLPPYIEPYGKTKAIATYSSIISRNSPIIQLNFQLSISSSAPVGLYYLTLRLNYVELNTTDSEWYPNEETHNIELAIIGRPELELTALNKSLITGSQNITILISNVGEQAARNVEFEISSTAAVVLSNSMYIEEIGPGNNVTLNIEVYVPSFIKGTTLSLTAIIKYRGPYNTEYTHTKTFDFTVGAYESPNIEVELVNKTVYVGQQILYIQLINRASETVYNITLDASSSNIYVNIISNYSIISKLSEGQSYTIPVKVYIPQRFEGDVVTIALELSYMDSSGASHYITKTLGIPVSRSLSQVINVLVNKNIVYSGKENTLNLIIINEGPCKASNATVIIKPQYPLEIRGNSTYTIGDLNVGSVANVNLSMYVFPVDSKISTQLPVTIEFINEYKNTRTLDSFLQIVVLPYKEMENIELTVEPKVLNSLGNASLLIKIANTGEGMISNIYLSIDTQSTKLLPGKKSFYIQELKPGETNVVSVPLIMSGQVSGVIPLSATLEYIDHLGQEHMVTYTQAIKVVPFDILLTIDIQPRSLLSQSIVNVTLTVANNGDVDLHDISIRVNIPSSTGIALLAPTVYHINNLSKSSKANIEVTLRTPKTTMPSKSSINVEVDYYDDQYNHYTQTCTLDLIVVPNYEEPEILIELAPKVLKVFSNTSLKIRVTNVGGSTISNLELDMMNMGPLIITKNFSSISMGSIEPGEAKVIAINVVVPNSPGAYKVSFNLEYSDAIGNTYTKIYSDVIKIEPSIISLSVDVQPKTLRSVSISDLKVKITNTGDVVVNNINLEIELPQQIISLANTSFYISKLEPGGSKTLTTTIKVNYVENTIITKLGLSTTYDDPAFQTHMMSRYINAELRPASIPSPVLQVSPGELTIGKVNRVRIRFNEYM